MALVSYFEKGYVMTKYWNSFSQMEEWNGKFILTTFGKE